MWFIQQKKYAERKFNPYEEASIFHTYSPIVIDLGVVQGVSYWNGLLERLNDKSLQNISVSDAARQILKHQLYLGNFILIWTLLEKLQANSSFANLSLSCQCVHLTPFQCLVILKCQTIGHDAPHWKPIFFPEVWCTALHMGAFWYHIIQFLDGYWITKHSNIFLSITSWRHFSWRQFFRRHFTWRHFSWRHFSWRHTLNFYRTIIERLWVNPL